MNSAFFLAQKEDGTLLYRARTDGQTTPVCSVAQASQRLKKSVRQIYRYIEAKTLTPVGKILGEWLLPVDQVRRLESAPVATQRMPQLLAALFPEYELRALNVGSHRELILSRVLDHGTMSQIRWALKRYSTGEIRKFLKEDGPRLLSPKSLALWSLFLDVKPQPLSWRMSDPWRK